MSEKTLTEGRLVEAVRELQLMKQVGGVREMVREMVETDGSYEFRESTHLPGSENVYVLRVDGLALGALEPRTDLCVVHPPGLREKAVELMAMVEESVRNPTEEREP